MKQHYMLVWSEQNNLLYFAEVHSQKVEVLLLSFDNDFSWIPSSFKTTDILHFYQTVPEAFHVIGEWEE